MAGGSFVQGGDVMNNDFSRFLLQLIIIIVCSQSVGRALRLVKIPMVIAEMIAGILLGPTVMGHVPGFTVNIFPRYAYLTS
jgi:Kef-type K+ transport system membrane component KefB